MFPQKMESLLTPPPSLFPRGGKFYPEIRPIHIYLALGQLHQAIDIETTGKMIYNMPSKVFIVVLLLYYNISLKGQ